MVKRIFNFQTSSVGLSAGILAISGLLSGLLGLFRDRLLASRFGASAQLDIYFAAFRIPDFIYNILIAGGIISVFLPVFSEYFNRNPKDGWRMTNIVLNWFFLFLVAICGILFIFIPYILNLIVPGFTPESKKLTVDLARIMLLSPIFFVVSSIFSGILHYFHRFLAYSFAPILYNLGIISGILFFVPIFGISGLAYGVVLGAFLYLVIQLFSATLVGFNYKPIFNFKDPGLKKILLLSLPRSLGAMASQFNLVFITGIASTLAVGSLSILNFSNNLQGLPISLIGVSFATAAFPRLAKGWAKGEKGNFIESFSSVFRQIIFLIVPISILMFLLRAQIVRIVLGTGEFGWRDTRLTAASLGILAFGIFALALIPLILRSFYSLQNTKIPVVIGIVTEVINIVFAFLFVFLLSYPNAFKNFIVKVFKIQGIDNIGVIGLAIALSLSALAQFFLLLFFLYKKLGNFKIKEILNSLIRILAASILMVIFTYLARQIIGYYMNLSTFFEVFFQLAISGVVGAVVYLLASLIFGSPEIKIIGPFVLNSFKKISNFYRNGTKTN